METDSMQLPAARLESLPVAGDAARPGVINEDAKFSGTWNGLKLVNRGSNQKLQKRAMRLSKWKHTSLTRKEMLEPNLLAVSRLWLHNLLTQ
jgi:hypothetical protein